MSGKFNHLKSANQFVAGILAFIAGISSSQAAEYLTYGKSIRNFETDGTTILFQDSGTMVTGSVPHGSSTVSTNIIKEGTPSVSAGVNTPLPVSAERGFARLTYGAVVYGPPDTTIGLGFKGAFMLTSSIGNSIEQHRSSASAGVNLASSSTPFFSADSSYASFGASLQNTARLNGLDEYLEWIRDVAPSSYSYSEITDSGGFVEHSDALQTLKYRGDGDDDPYYDSVTGYFDGVLHLLLNPYGAAYLTVSLDVAVSGSGIDDSATAFVDPYLYIDPADLLKYPETRLEIETGVGNGLATPSDSGSTVPEPTTAMLVAIALALLLGRRPTTKQGSYLQK